MFARKRVNTVAVIDDEGVISGIVTSSDLVAINNDNLLLQDILTPNVHIYQKDNRIKDAAEAMVKHNIHHLIVIEDFDVVRTVSFMDIVYVCAEA